MMKGVFSASGEYMGTDGILRRNLGTTTSYARLTRRQSGLCGAKGSCDALKPRGPVDHRQPAETCVSYIMRPVHE